MNFPSVLTAASWIWTERTVSSRNAFVRFRREFNYEAGRALLHLTADSRYVLWINGHYLGQGPVRAWPSHWHYDTYDLAPHLKPGKNAVCVLVNHWGEGTFQYLAAPPGLLAQLDLEEDSIVSDASWLASPSTAFIADAPRTSVQLSFEEQFDARQEDEWKVADYDASFWAPATPVRPAEDGFHADLKPRDIPFLTLEPVLPQRLVKTEVVESLPYHFTLYLKSLLVPDDLTSNHIICSAYIATQIWSPCEAQVKFVYSHKAPSQIKVNGELLTLGESYLEASHVVRVFPAQLHQGWNDVLISLPNRHLQEYTLSLDGPLGLRFSAHGEGGDAGSWALVGPFDLAPETLDSLSKSTSHASKALVPEATAERAVQVWEAGKVATLIEEPFFQTLEPQHLPTTDVYAQFYTDRPVDGAIRVDREEALLSGADWTTVYPSENGDVRLLLDFGKEIIGYHRFDVVAAQGTVLDWHGFEFIQPDGRLNFTEELNNSFRYICREGSQSYQSYHRRGFQFCHLTIRNQKGPVQLRGVEVLFNTYPQARRGSFACSDPNLDRIWQAGAHTLRLCAEDTFTDCPTYEQTHWVGDMRNEGLVDWAANGDPRLWFHCLEQAGQSLERSPLVESQVPSSWEIILPAWSFLWMRSCREYFLFSGDRDGANRLLPWVERNVAGIKSFLNDQRLFEIKAWNLFDWAAMDTPSMGVVTHNNCFVVHALRDVAQLAEWLGREDLATKWRSLADEVSAAINAHLWSEEIHAFTDCSRSGVQSTVFSQQTHTVAVMSGVAADHSEERAERCRSLLHSSPEGFVQAGSPFFEFFLLEAYQSEGRDREFLDTIRRDWGFMLDTGANTFWEMWSNPGKRLTRSHCHGWSAAPTYFLSTHVLGVAPDPLDPTTIVVAPHPADLKWCRGSMPTSYGTFEVQWEDLEGQPFELRVKAPEAARIRVHLPRVGNVSINGKPGAAAVDASRPL
jgi:alpha-L-rhamnosidase